MTLCSIMLKICFLFHAYFRCAEELNGGLLECYKYNVEPDSYRAGDLLQDYSCAENLYYPAVRDRARELPCHILISGHLVLWRRQLGRKFWRWQSHIHVLLRRHELSWPINDVLHHTRYWKGWAWESPKPAVVASVLSCLAESVQSNWCVDCLWDDELTNVWHIFVRGRRRL